MNEFGAIKRSMPNSFLGAGENSAVFQMRTAPALIVAEEGDVRFAAVPFVPMGPADHVLITGDMRHLAELAAHQLYDRPFSKGLAEDAVRQERLSLGSVEGLRVAQVRPHLVYPEPLLPEGRFQCVHLLIAAKPFDPAVV